jgi:hypothetical protein
MILFNEEVHKYTVESAPDMKLTSVSTIISLLKEKFDADYWAEKKAKERGITKEEILKEWEDKKIKSQERGTAFHLEKEKEALAKKGAVPAIVRENGLKQSFDLKSLTPGVYPELIVYSLLHNAVGTADIVEIYEDKTFFLGDYKGFPLDTEVPTKVGFKLIKDLVVGDEIFDGQGCLTKVKAKSDVHYNPCYKIKFDTNEEVVCDEDHKWLITSYTYKKVPVEKVMTTKEIMEHYDCKGKKLTIKNAALNLPEADLPIDPYVFGCWLGDGAAASGSITNMNSKLWKEIEIRGYILGNDISQGGSGKAQIKTIIGLRTKLKEMGVLNNKHLPDMYLKGSRQQRLDLLRGFMDTDGSFNRTRKRCVMNTTKKWQVEALCSILFSLGEKPTVMPYKTSGFGKSNIEAFSISFTMKESPFLTRNEDYDSLMVDVSFYKSKHRYIKSIDKVDTIPTICIAVESPLHTYLVTRNYLPTHNTNQELKFESFKRFDKISKERKPVMMNSPVQHLEDCSGMHYTLQLSLYAYMLEQFGFTCKELKIYHAILNENNECVNVIEYPIEYKKKEAHTILNWFKKQNNE